MALDVTNVQLLDKINKSQVNPSAILQTVVSLMEDANAGTVSYVDPSNPVITQIETSAVIHTSSVQQHIAALRGLYPNLAQTPEDLYNHMSYRDYLNRFASPSTDPFYFFVSLNQFINKAVAVPDTNYSMITIPRDTTITVNKYVTFTLQYPINIKYFDTNSIEVSYNNSIESPLQDLTTNIIVSDVLVDPNSRERWIRFTLPAPQVSVNKVTGNVQPGAYYVNTIDFTDQYCMTRAWYRSGDTAEWKEMLTTYSPTVYDPDTPTVQLKVIGQTLNVSLPLIYQSTNSVIGELRFDVYTTKGSEIINLGDYPMEQFILNMESLDPNRDLDVYTAAALRVSTSCRSTSIMSGGKDALSFAALKERVINSSIGPQNTPITNIDIQSAAENMGFSLVPNIDVVTNRIFLATRSLPTPTNTRLVTSANIGISTYVTDDPSEIVHPWVKVHGKRTTFLSKNLYQSNNGSLTLLSADAVEALKLLPPDSKLTTVNNNSYLYTPFYYVLDTNSLELMVRPYHLDQPVASDLNFKDQNTTLQLVVNTSGYNLQKIDNGYKLTISTNSGNFYKQLPDNEIYAQLAVKLKNSTRYAYWLGTQIDKTETGERIFEFTILTEYDINEDNQIIFTNGKIDASSQTPIEVDLSSPFEIFHITTSLTGLYKPSDMDDLIGRFMISAPCAAITREFVTMEFGKYLGSLWSRGRTLPDSDIYQRYNQDVYRIAQEDIFNEPPFTIDENGELVWNILYKKGDTELDNQGNPIIEHYKGDIVKFNGEPVIDKTLVGSREFDMLMVDGRHYFVDDAAYLAYNREFVTTIVDWVTEDLPSLQARTLEKTKIFFYPKNQLTRTTLVVDDYVEQTIPSEQSITIDAYVVDGILTDPERSSALSTQTIKYLANWISNPRVAISDAVVALQDIYGDSADAIKVYGIGGSKDIQLVVIAFEEQRLTLKRILDVQMDGTFIIREDVTINLLKANPIPLAE